MAPDQQREFAVNFQDRKSGEMRLSIKVPHHYTACLATWHLPGVMTAKEILLHHVLDDAGQSAVLTLQDLGTVQLRIVVVSWPVVLMSPVWLPAGD